MAAEVTGRTKQLKRVWPSFISDKMKKWLPLESNPEVLTDFASKLGLDVSGYSFHDVYGLDEELLAMVPQPVIAVLLLFPITDASEKAKQEEEDRIAKGGQTVSPSVYFMRQTIGNACGTIGVLHSLANNQGTVTIGPNTFLRQFLEATASLSPAERGKYLEDPPAGAPSIESIHQESAAVGDTAPPSSDEDVDLHFVALVHKDGHLYELDGRKAAPVNHGPTTPETLLHDSAAVVQKFIATTDSINFNLIALANSGE